jgi:hypothetical protein
VERTDVVVAGEVAELRAECEKRGLCTRTEKGRLVVEVRGAEPVSRLLGDVLARGLEVIEVAPRYKTLEELFVRAEAAANTAAEPAARAS